MEGRRKDCDKMRPQLRVHPVFAMWPYLPDISSAHHFLSPLGLSARCGYHENVRGRRHQGGGGNSTAELACAAAERCQDKCPSRQLAYDEAGWQLAPHKKEQGAAPISNV